MGSDRGLGGSSLASMLVSCRTRGVSLSSTAVHLIRPSTPSDHRPANPVTTPLIPGTESEKDEEQALRASSVGWVFAEEPGAGTPGFSLSGLTVTLSTWSTTLTISGSIPKGTRRRASLVGQRPALAIADDDLGPKPPPHSLSAPF